VQDMPTLSLNTAAGHASIADMIVRLGHNLKLQVIAEGVENAAQLEALRALGCDEAQGYHICHPIPTAAFEHWLLERGMFEPVAGA
jgi:diguanylate cyclase